jgi:hypothetical protein
MVHSFHSYFLLRAVTAIDKPIVYDVEVLRDGNSFQRAPRCRYPERPADFLYDSIIPGAGKRF